MSGPPKLVIDAAQNNEIECTKCPFVGEYVHLLLQHRITAHNMPPASCIYCDVSFESHRHLGEHMVREHPLKSHGCGYCNFRAHEINEIGDHIKTEHPDMSLVINMYLLPPTLPR